MYTGALQFFIPKLIGLGDLKVGATKSDQGKDVFVTSYWIAEIYDYEFYSDDRLTISVVSTSEWVKGVLLIPPRPVSNQKTLNDKQPTYAIDLKGWTDVVAQSLHSIDIHPPYEIQNSEKFRLLEFSIKCFNQTNEAAISVYRQTTYSSSLYALQQALVKTMLHLVKSYDNEEMRLFTRNYS